MRTRHVYLLSICAAILASYPLNTLAQQPEENKGLTIERVPLIQIRMDNTSTTPAANSPTAPKKAPTTTKPAPAPKVTTQKSVTQKQSVTKTTRPAAKKTTANTPDNEQVTHTVNNITYNITNNIYTSDKGDKASNAAITMTVVPDAPTVLTPLTTPPNIQSESTLEDNKESNTPADKKSDANTAATNNTAATDAPANSTQTSPETPINDTYTAPIKDPNMQQIRYTTIPNTRQQVFYRTTGFTAQDSRRFLMKIADNTAPAAPQTNVAPAVAATTPPAATPATPSTAAKTKPAAKGTAPEKKGVKKNTPNNTNTAANNTKKTPILVAQNTAQKPAEAKLFADSQPKVPNPPQPYGLWIKSNKGTAKKPTIIALHGCGGLYTSFDDGGKLTPRHETMARVFTSAGFNVLFPDSFLPRGVYGNCTESLKEWVKTSKIDRLNVESSLKWLATQDDVDMNRIVLFGWSYGATVMLEALNLAYTDVAIRDVQPKAAIGFYPYCEPFLDPKEPYKLAAPAELFIGQNDTWTPAKFCERFEDRLVDSETRLSVFTYPDTYHDFDAPGTPIYVRLDVSPADGKPGGITAGGNPTSRAAAYKEILLFLRDRLNP